MLRINWRHKLAVCIASLASGSDRTIVWLVHEDWRYNVLQRFLAGSTEDCIVCRTLGLCFADVPLGTAWPVLSGYA